VSHTIDERLWRKLSEEVISGMKEWRLQHPKATLREIESALDQKLAYGRARMLEDMALASRVKEWTNKSQQQPQCPQCGAQLDSSGNRERRLQTQGGQEITLKRSYGICPACGSGFFPPR
jgi:YgiT-type zinc finger domain-containing protein